MREHRNESRLQEHWTDDMPSRAGRAMVTVLVVESILSTSSTLRSDPNRSVCSLDEAVLAVGADEGASVRFDDVVAVSAVMDDTSRAET